MTDCRQLFKDGKYAEAITYLDIKLANDADNIEILADLVSAYYMNGNYDECISTMERMVDIVPDKLQALTNMGNIFVKLGDEKVERKLLDKAVEAFNDAISLDQKDKSLYYEKGKTLEIIGFEWRESKKLEEGIEAFDKAIALDKNYVDAYFKKGRTLLRLARLGYKDKFAESIQLFDKVIELDNAHALAYYHKGQALFFTGKILKSRKLFEVAIVAYETSIELDPNYSKAHGERGLASLRIGKDWDEIDKIEEGLAFMNKALELDPENAGAYVNRAAAYICLGNYYQDMEMLKQAVNDCDTGMSLNVNTVSVYYSKGSALSYIAVLERSRAACKEAILALDVAAGFEPDKAAIYTDKAAVMVLLGYLEKNGDMLSEAIAVLDKALQLDPFFVKANINKGCAFLTIGEINNEIDKFRLAMNCFDEAIKVDGNHPIAFFRKASLLIKMTAITGKEDDHEIFKNYLRGIYLSEKEINKPFELLKFLLANVDAPHLVNRLLAIHPFLKTGSQYAAEIEEAEQAYYNYRNAMVQLRKELIAGYSDNAETQFYLYRAIAEYLGGDPIAAFKIHDADQVDELLCDNLQHQYYYSLSANDILHPDAGAILSFALNAAARLCGPEQHDALQLYYAGCIHMLDRDYTEAITLLERSAAAGYNIALFRLMECYSALDNREQKRVLTERLRDEGLFDSLFVHKKYTSAYAELDSRIQQYESLPGWYAAGMVIDDRHEALSGSNIPANRSKYSFKVEPVNYPKATQAEINALDPERLQKLENTCRERMVDIFPFYENAKHLKDETVAEDLLDNMINERKLSGRVMYHDYADLLSYCFATNKISQEGCLLTGAYLSLKCEVLNRGQTSNGFAIVSKNITRQVLKPLINALGGVTYGIPINLIIKLIVDNKDAETINIMNFRHFKRHYNELCNYKPNDLLETLKGNDWVNAAEDWLGN
ncbi:MAG: tetratricopeptide repeat protein [Mucilaginibacter sp.]